MLDPYLSIISRISSATSPVPLVREIHLLLQRDLYYADKTFFGTQQVVDEAFDNLACMLHVPRSSLHVVTFLTISLILLALKSFAVAKFLLLTVLKF